MGEEGFTESSRKGSRRKWKRRFRTKGKGGRETTEGSSAVCTAENLSEICVHMDTNHFIR